MKINHLVTYQCPRHCSYCINKYLIKKESDPIGSNFKEVYNLLNLMGYEHLILTGGEPTLYKDIGTIINCARNLFIKVDMMTANSAFVQQPKLFGKLNSIMYSIHEDSIYEIPSVHNISCNIYASIMVPALCKADHVFKMPLWKLLQMKGYKGLTIRERYPNGKPDLSLIPTFANFSIRYKPVNTCIPKHLMLPDFTLINQDDFRK